MTVFLKSVNFGCRSCLTNSARDPAGTGTAASSRSWSVPPGLPLDGFPTALAAQPPAAYIVQPDRPRVTPKNVAPSRHEDLRVASWGGRGRSLLLCLPSRSDGAVG